MRIHRVVALVTAVLLVGAVGTASAQNYSTDARKIAMGGNGGDSSNIASGMVDKASPYTAIVLPLGLIQLFGNNGLDKFNPDKSTFDPVQAIEDVTNPIHYTFGRGEVGTGQQKFINDLRNGTISTNLTSYTGFHIPTSFRAQGLGIPEGGGTIKFSKSKSGAFQGIYIGAGPYLGFDTGMTVDQPLATMLSTGTAQTCSPCIVTNASHVQVAMAVTFGYRGRVALAGGSARDGVYYAYNYHYLKGFEYMDDNIRVRLDTTPAGAITTPPVSDPVPLSITSFEAKDGKGRASDFGFVVVKNYFEVGFGVNGIGNHIDWTDFTQRAISINLLNAAVGCPPNVPANQCNNGVNNTEVASAISAMTVKMPVVVSESLAFQAKGWGFMGSLEQKKAQTSTPSGVCTITTTVCALGYNDKGFHGGVERALGPLWLRVGGRYARQKWDPTYGFGIGNKVALDFGFYGTHANLEGKRQTTMAVSVRFNHTPKASQPSK